eukprot:246871-Amphidinium_carterae.1
MAVPDLSSLKMFCPGLSLVLPHSDKHGLTFKDRVNDDNCSKQSARIGKRNTTFCLSKLHRRVVGHGNSVCDERSLGQKSRMSAGVALVRPMPYALYLRSCQLLVCRSRHIDSRRSCSPFEGPSHACYCTFVLYTALWCSRA